MFSLFRPLSCCKKPVTSVLSCLGLRVAVVLYVVYAVLKISGNPSIVSFVLSEC